MRGKELKELPKQFAQRRHVLAVQVMAFLVEFTIFVAGQSRYLITPLRIKGQEATKSKLVELPIGNQLDSQDKRVKEIREISVRALIMSSRCANTGQEASKTALR